MTTDNETVSESTMTADQLDAAIETDLSRLKAPGAGEAGVPARWELGQIRAAHGEAHQARQKADQIIARAEMKIRALDQRLAREELAKQAHEIREQASREALQVVGALLEVGRAATAQQPHWTSDQVLLRTSSAAGEESWARRIDRMPAHQLRDVALAAVGASDQTAAVALRREMLRRNDVTPELRRELEGLLAGLGAPAEAVEASRLLQELRYLGEMAAVEVSAGLRRQPADPLERIQTWRRWHPDAPAIA